MRRIKLTENIDIFPLDFRCAIKAFKASGSRKDLHFASLPAAIKNTHIFLSQRKDYFAIEFQKSKLSANLKGGNLKW